MVFKWAEAESHFPFGVQTFLANLTNKRVALNRRPSRCKRDVIPLDHQPIFNFYFKKYGGGRD